jgi:hypothetical protein
MNINSRFLAACIIPVLAVACIVSDSAAQTRASSILLSNGSHSMLIMAPVSGGLNQTLTLPTGTGTLALLSDIPGASNVLNLGTNGPGGTAGTLNILDGGDPGSIGMTITDSKIFIGGSTFMHAFGGGVFLGTNAGNLTLTGVENTAVGDAAAAVLTSGSSNTAIGRNSMGSATTAASNTAVGTMSLYVNDDGSNNTAIGTYALVNNTANANTAVGSNAGYANTTGVQNTGIGREALRDNSTGIENTGLGHRAGFRITGSGNTAIGNGTFGTLTSGSDNTALGAGADVSTASLTNATAIGKNAIVTASNSIQLGNTSVTLVNTAGSVAAGTGFTATTGNVAITDGNLTLPSTSATAGQITVSGSRFMHSYNGTFLGKNAGNFTSTGTGNVGIGEGALQNHTTNNNNTAVGYQSLQANNTGFANAALGTAALWLNTTGSSNTALGTFALLANTTGSQNTGLGYAVLNTLTTGTGNTAIGRSADVATGNQTNSTAIGYGAIATASNTIQLGNGSVTLVNTAGSVTAGTGFTATTGNVAITGGDLTLAGTTRISNAGAGTLTSLALSGPLTGLSSVSTGSTVKISETTQGQTPLAILGNVLSNVDDTLQTWGVSIAGTLAYISQIGAFVTEASIYAEDQIKTNSFIDATGYISSDDALKVNSTAAADMEIGESFITRNAGDIAINPGSSNKVTTNGGVVLGGTTAAAGAKLTMHNGHLQTKQTANATGSLCGGMSSVGFNGTDVAGTISCLTNGAPGNTCAFLNYDVDYATAPIVQLTPTNQAAAAEISKFYVESLTSGFYIRMVSPNANTTYTFSYFVIETE